MTLYQKLDKHIAEGNAERILAARAIYNHGTNNQYPTFYRYVVLDVVFDPQMVDVDKVNYWEALGVSNIKFARFPPRNAIIGQRISDGLSSASERPMILYPFFPSHLALPCKPGEHVWVMFEAPGAIKMDMGYWFCKISEIGYVEDVNHTHAPRSFEPSFLPGTKDKHSGSDETIYEFRNGKVGETEGQRYTIPETAVLRDGRGAEPDAYEKLLTQSDASKVTNYESIPRYRKRPADLALEGSNNTLIVLGTDRANTVAIKTFTEANSARGIVPSLPDSDINKKSGAIDIVVGRGQVPETGGETVTSKKVSDGSEFKEELQKAPGKVKPAEGDPDYINDKSRILVSQQTKVDEKFQIDDYNKQTYNISSGLATGGVVIKSDKIRIIARQDVEILVTGVNPSLLPNITDSANVDTFAAVVIRENGDIIFRPSKTGYIKLGDDSADRAILCTDAPAVTNEGAVAPTTPAITTTMGGAFGGTGQPTQGTWARKVLVTGAKLCLRKNQVVNTPQVR